MTPLGIGIIGYGGFGRFLHQAWDTGSVYRVVAISDERAEARPDSTARFYRDPQGLVDDPSVDIVSIATPPDSHEPLALAAMAAGKHVLIEKPLAITLDAGRRIAEAARNGGRVASVNFMMRFNPIVEALVALQESGLAGPLRRFVVENYAQDESLGPDHWFWDRRRSGGILIEHSVHFVDLANRLSRGAALRVQGQAVRREDGRVDRMGLSAVYEDGLVMSQYHAFTRPNIFERTRMRFVFDLAEIDVEGWIPMDGRMDVLANEETANFLLATFPHANVRRSDALVPGKSMEREPHAGQPALRTPQSALRSGGRVYPVDRRLDVSFQVGTGKPEAYTTALRWMMTDVVAAVRDPRRMPRVTLEDGLRSLEIAGAATRDALGEE